MKYDPTKKLEIYGEREVERLGYLNEKDDYIVVIPRESKFFESLVEFQNKMIETKELSCPSTPSTTEGGTQKPKDEILVLSRALNTLRMDLIETVSDVNLLRQRSSELEALVRTIIASTSTLKQDTSMGLFNLSNLSSSQAEAQEKRSEG